MANPRFLINSLSYKFVIFFIAIAYAYILTVQPVDLFVDRNNYLSYALNSGEIFNRYLAQGWLSVFFNEPLWLGVNISLGSLFSPESTLRAIIFFSSFVTAYLVLRYKAKWFFLLLLFLLLPQVIKNNIIHLRQGLAISIFLCGWFSRDSIFKNLLYILACLIHSSFFIILLLILLDRYLRKFRFSSEIRAIVVLITGLTIGIVGLQIAGLFGARQANEYTGDSAAVSGMGFIFWALVAIVFALQGRAFIRRNSLELSIIVFYLSTYFFLPVTARVFESGLLLVLISALQLTSYRKFMFISLFFFYFAIQWGSRLFLPGFGWAT